MGMTTASAKPSSSRLGTIILMVVLVIAAMIAGVFFANRGMVKLFAKQVPTAASAVPVKYDDVGKYLEQNVTVTGYLIVPNGDNVCFAAWPTCRLWLDNDPTQPGMGLHEAEFRLGDSANEITANGQLHDRTGSVIPITENDAFSWYHITITGKVTICKDSNCIIEVQSIRAK
jgi:hypothetical protein